MSLPADVCLAAVSPQISDFLCEKGIFYFNQEKYPEALTEFKKALLANPESSIAKDFIGRIEEKTPTAKTEAKERLIKQISSVASSLDSFEKKEKSGAGQAPALPKQDVQELERSVLSRQRGKTPGLRKLMAPGAAEPPVPQETVIDINRKEEGLDTSQIQTNVAERIVMKGKNITRFLVTNPAFLKAQRLNNDEILVEPQEIGSSYMHLWDDEGTKTFKLTIGPRRYEEELLQEARQRYLEASRPESFKVSYSLQDSSFYTGRRLDDLERRTHSLSYSSSLIGETPFGNIDAAVSGTRTNFKTYRINNLRLGLTRGHYDQFKDINLRFFDFTPTFPSFGFPAADLRGVMIQAPMFQKRFNYMGFWGAIPQGTFTDVSQLSGLSRTKKAWLEGFGGSYKFGNFATFRSFYARSYGPERIAPILTEEVTGFGMDYHFGWFDIGTDVAYDMLKSVSYTATSNMTFPKLQIGLSMTENSKDFASLFGGEPAGGSTGGSLSIRWRPVQNIMVSNIFLGKHDKVFGNPDDPDRPNYNSTTRFQWFMDAHTELELGYTMDDQQGTVAPSLTETKEVIIRKKLYFFRKLNTYLNFQDTKSKNFTSPAQDFHNNRILAGLSFRVLGELYCYYNREFNFLKNQFSGEAAQPTAQEVGFTYYRRIFESPFYMNSRIFYRDEQNTESVLSFLSGEDRLEGSTELTFRPNPDSEAFLRFRIANIWAEKAGVAKHMDLDLSWGLRFIWDTGLRWQAVGGFAGFVFYDTNADGIKQADEKGVKGVQIRSSDGKASVTDQRGYYKIAGLVGKAAVLEMDLKTIPKGYNATTSVQRDAEIVHAKTKRVDFGIATRSEVSGLVFHDKNGNGKYDAGEQGVRGVVVILDDKEKTATSTLGEYMFRKLAPGEHTLKLDLKSLPVKFIPKVPVIKKVSIVEGATFVYNVPLSEQVQAKEKESPKK